MLNDYTFLTDHSYSLRPVSDDNDEELALKKREVKSQKRRRSSIRSRMNWLIFSLPRIFIDFHVLIEKTPSASKRKVSIDRSSSDKENSSSSSNASVSVTKTNPSNSSQRRRSRLSTRLTMTTSGKKQDNKSSSKVGQLRFDHPIMIDFRRMWNIWRRKSRSIEAKQNLCWIPVMHHRHYRLKNVWNYDERMPFNQRLAILCQKNRRK